jgi:hypothetical protein
MAHYRCHHILTINSATAKGNAAQQSVQPTGGILRRFRAFFWLRVFSALEANLVPPTSG